jgi:hypothetical protein
MKSPKGHLMSLSTSTPGSNQNTAIAFYGQKQLTAVKQTCLVAKLMKRLLGSWSLSSNQATHPLHYRVFETTATSFSHNGTPKKRNTSVAEDMGETQEFQSDFVTSWTRPGEDERHADPEG